MLLALKMGGTLSRMRGTPYTHTQASSACRRGNRGSTAAAAAVATTMTISELVRAPRFCRGGGGQVGRCGWVCVGGGGEGVRGMSLCV